MPSDILIATLLAVRKEANMRPVEFAASVGVPYTYLRRWLAGRHRPTADQALTLLAWLSQHASQKQKQQLSKKLKIKLP